MATSGLTSSFDILFFLVPSGWYGTLRVPISCFYVSEHGILFNDVRSTEDVDSMIPYEDPRYATLKSIKLGREKQHMEFSLKIIVALEMVFDDDNDHVKELPF